MIFKLAWKNILHKPLNALLSWILLSVSVSVISILLILQYHFEKQYTQNIKGIDLVLGAKGSPLQLILSAIYHIDAPTGNISYHEAQKWMEHPYVEKAIPLAYGDSYKGYSIIGSDTTLLQHYQATLQKGNLHKENFEVVAGSTVAGLLQLKIGDKFFSSHGNDEHGEEHTHQAYTVTGILNPTGSVVDNLLISNIESVWKIHDHHDEHHHQSEDHTEHHHHEEEDITAVLLQFRNPMGNIQLPRLINEQTNLMAAVPAIEINRLFTLFGVGANILKNIGIGIMFLSALSVFVALYNSLKERKYELALMRTTGASRGRIAGLLILEGAILSIAGLITGILLSRVVLFFMSDNIRDGYNFSLNRLWSLSSGETELILLTLLLGLIAAFIPAVKAWFINISKTLSNE